MPRRKQRSHINPLLRAPQRARPIVRIRNGLSAIPTPSTLPRHLVNHSQRGYINECDTLNSSIRNIPDLTKGGLWKMSEENPSFKGCDKTLLACTRSRRDATKEGTSVSHLIAISMSKTLCRHVTLILDAGWQTCNGNVVPSVL